MNIEVFIPSERIDEETEIDPNIDLQTFVKLIIEKNKQTESKQTW